jgi:hypothetical protein
MTTYSVTAPVLGIGYTEGNKMCSCAPWALSGTDMRPLDVSPVVKYSSAERILNMVQFLDIGQYFKSSNPLKKILLAFLEEMILLNWI